MTVVGKCDQSSLIIACLRKIIHDNNHTKFWYSIRDITPYISEAAPDMYLDAVEDASMGNDSPLQGLFQTEESGTFGRCYHSGLLWGLELLSWDKNYTARVCSCLARLSEIDPGGKWANRPMNSLINIFLGWINNTVLTHKERVDVIKNILIPNHPDVSWNLMVKLLIGNSTTTAGIQKPKYREVLSYNSRPSRNEYYTYVSSIVDLMIDQVKKDPERRIVDIVAHFDSYKNDQTNVIIQWLLSFDVRSIKCNQRRKIVDELRNLLAMQRECRNPKWTWPESLLARIEEIYNHFNFKDVIPASVYLFDDYYPQIIKPTKLDNFDYGNRQKLVSICRNNVIEKIYHQFGIDGILELVRKCKLPRLVGKIVASSKYSNDILNYVLNSFCNKGSEGEFSKGYITEMVINSFEKAISKLDDHWASNEKVTYLLCFPLTHEILIYINQNCSETEKHFYWENIKDFRVNDEKESELVATNLLKHERPFAAMQALSYVVIHAKNLDSKLLGSILTEIALHPKDIEQVSLQEIQFSILSSIKYIQGAGELSNNEICQIEWYYLQWFMFEDVHPKFLIKRIVKDPKFYCQLIGWVYKRNDGNRDPEEEIPSELKTQRAKNSFALISTLNYLPGQNGKDVTYTVLLKWISKARTNLEKIGRVKIGDFCIGQYLSRGPVGKDGVCVHESVRNIVELLKNKEIERGLINGVINSRGVTSRNPFEGGKQEKDLETKYFKQAEIIRFTYPRTAKVLRKLAENYASDAKMEDIEAELQ